MLKTKRRTHLHLASFFSLLFLLGLAGCQQKVPSQGFAPAPVQSEPKMHDKIIIDGEGQPVQPVLQNPALKPEIQKGPVGLLNYNHASDRLSQLKYNIDLYDYSDRIQNASIKKKAVVGIKSIISAPGYLKPIRFTDSSYAKLFYHQSQPQFMKATAGLQDLFERQQTAVLNIIQTSNFTLLKMPAVLTLDSAFKATTDYISDFEKRIDSSKTLKAEVKNGIKDGLNKQFWMKLSKAKAALDRPAPVGSHEFQTTLNKIVEFITQFEVELTESDKAALSQAQGISENLTKELTDKEALAFIIQIWESLPPQERESVFAQASPEFHDFLSNKSEKERNCLKLKKCKNLILRIVRKLFILPQIRKLGIPNLQKQIGDAALEKLNATIDEAARTSIMSLPQRLQGEILGQLQKELEKYLGYRKNYSAFLSEELGTWYELEFGKSTLNYVPADLSPTNLAYAIQGIKRLAENEKSETVKAEMHLSLIHLMLSNGGYSTVDKKPASTLLVSKTEKSGMQFVNLEAFHLPVGRLGYRTPKGDLRLTVEDRSAMMAAFRDVLNILKPIAGAKSNFS